MSRIKVNVQKAEPVWRDRKRNFLGLHWSFTEYTLSEDRLFIRRGIDRQRAHDQPEAERGRHKPVSYSQVFSFGFSKHRHHPLSLID